MVFDDDMALLKQNLPPACRDYLPNQQLIKAEQMPPSIDERVALAKEARVAIREVMDIFQAERLIYLGGATAAMLLLIYVAIIAIRSSTGLSLEDGAALLGSGGLFAVTGGRTIILLQQSFALISKLLLSSVEGDVKQ